MDRVARFHIKILLCEPAEIRLERIYFPQLPIGGRSSACGYKCAAVQLLQKAMAAILLPELSNTAGLNRIR